MYLNTKTDPQSLPRLKYALGRSMSVNDTGPNEMFTVRNKNARFRVTMKGLNNWFAPR